MVTEHPAGLELRVLALVPAHNEAEYVGAVVEAARRYVPVLVIDDGSADETADAARRAGAEVFRLSPNRGKGGALKAGFRKALAQGYEAVLTLDADGQHAPDEIPLFLAAYRNGRSDLIIGARDQTAMPPVRWFANLVSRWAFSRVMGEFIPDNQSGYRLIGRRLLGLMLESQEEGFAFEVEMIAVCLRSGMRLEWVPVSTIYGEEKSDIRPWTHFASFLRVLRRARAARREH